MEVREPSAKFAVPHFKRTEAGDIPMDWLATPIGEMADVTSGGTPSRKVAAFWGGGIPWVTTAELDRGEVMGASQSITEAGLQNSAAKWLPAGTLLIALYGQGKTRGKCAALRIAATTNQACAGIKLTDDVDGDFVRHNLAHRYEYIRSLSNGGSQENLSGEIVKKIRVGMPSTRAEQRAIGCALSDADALIHSLQQLLTKKLQIKEGATQELLTGRRRLPGFEGDWAEWCLVKLAEIRSGGTPSTRQPEFWDGDIPWCTPTEITALAGGKYISSTGRCITDDGLKASSAEILPVGTVVMTSRATIGECAIASVPLTTNQGFKNFVPHSETSGEFLYYLLGTLQQAFLALCSGSTFLEIGKRQLADFTVRCPVERDEQTAIAQVLCEMDADIAAVEARLTKARAIKQAMAQALLTGRIRLVEPAA
jgi:type I restriction enzyme S subunit